MSDKEHPRISGLKSLPLAATAPGSFVRVCHDYLLAASEEKPAKEQEALRLKAYQAVKDAIARKDIDTTLETRSPNDVFVDVLHSVAEQTGLPFPGEKKVAGLSHADRVRSGKSVSENIGNTDYKAAGIAWLIEAQSGNTTPRKLAGLKRQFRNALERAILEDEGIAPARPDMDERAANVVQQIARDTGLPVPGTVNRGK